MYSYRYPFLYLLLLTFFPICASAQVWQADFSTEGTPTEKHWRYDRGLYHISGGALHLAVPKEPVRGSASIVTNVTLPTAPVWRGQVKMDLIPTAYNHATILLCAIKALDTQSYEYVALDFGQGGQQHISLRRVKVERSGGNPAYLTLSPLGRPLISSSTTLNASGSWDYDVRYSAEGGWQLYLREAGSEQEWELIGEEEDFRPTLPEKNTFGISCTFTSTHHTGWHFRQLRIYPTSETDPIGDEGTSPRPDPVPTPIPQPKSGLLLSEIMPHPKTDCPEYIELYNASDAPCELGDYALAAGRDGSSYKITPLPLRSIPAGSYIVITKDPDALAKAYPNAPREVFVKASFPRLLNQSGLIGLLLGDDGLVVDLLHYDSSLLPKGMKSKAGIALERKDYKVIEEAGNWHAAARSAGFATPGQKNSSAEEGGGNQDDTPQKRLSDEELFTLLDSSPDGECHFTLYRLTGELLARGTSLARDSWIQSLRTMPADALRIIGVSAEGPLLLHIKLTRPDGTRLERSLLFRIVGL
ncbi:lamin tail domain-containing protein [Porphyromonas bobii]|uniref:lamin tail domain-containing protein n=1 Tax=Porphyromonas bobii TaxID=2811780 RepID=UPI001C003905|nr:lamin tail domain-containing protein [Porphyromonas bobii]